MNGANVNKHHLSFSYKVVISTLKLLMGNRTSKTSVYRSFFFGQLTAPPYPFVGGGAFAGILELKVAGGELTFLLPVIPAFGTNLRRQRAMHEQRIAVVAPGTAQIDLRHVRGTTDGTFIKDVAIRNLLRSGGGGDVAIGLAIDVAMLKPSRRGTEDEVGGALDIAVFEEETCAGHARIDGILIAEETAVDEREPVALGMQGYSLSQLGRIILDGDVLQGDVVAFDLQRVGAEGAYLLR